MKRSSQHGEQRYSGVGLSGGMVVARVCLFNEQRHNNLPLYRVAGEEDRLREQQRFEQAVDVASERLEALRRDVAERIGEAEAGIFAVQVTILRDAALGERVRGVMDEGLNAETAVSRALDRYEERLREVDSEYVRERASDIGEVRRRLLDVLADMNPSLQCEGQGHCQRGAHRVVVAEELTPTLTVDLNTGDIRGFVTERGGPQSHAAILARALAVPAVSGIDGIRGRVSCGTEILVDGDAGEVVVWPEEETIRNAQDVQRDLPAVHVAVDPVPGLRVMANIATTGDLDDAVRMKAEGVGLYRTEFECFRAGRLLSAEEQRGLYREVLQRMGDREVVFRLLDFGGDKPFEPLDMPRERNPALGCRGARLLLQQPGLVRTQARALVEAAGGRPLSVLYPMIGRLEHFLALKRIFEQAVQDQATGSVRHGVMLEVPAVCLDPQSLLSEADFASIGTNDLLQYLYAVDRDSGAVDDDIEPTDPVFWNLLRGMTQAAHKASCPLTLCGEIAADPRWTAEFLDMHLEAVSVSPLLIPRVRDAVRSGQGRPNPSLPDRK